MTSVAIPSTASEVGWTRILMARSCLRKYILSYPDDPLPWKRYEVQEIDDRYAPYLGKEVVPVQAPEALWNPSSPSAQFGSLVHLLLAAVWSGNPEDLDLVRNHPLYGAAASTARAVLNLGVLEGRGYQVIPESVEQSLWDPETTYCQRADGVLRDSDGGIWIYDIKTSQRDRDRRSSGQFHAFAWLGKKNFGDAFRGIMVLEIKIDREWRFKSVTPIPLTGFETEPVGDFIRETLEMIEEAVAANKETEALPHRSYSTAVCRSWGRECPHFDGCFPVQVDVNELIRSSPYARTAK
jgi:hypothetical protein